jgi:Fe-Mn family superoxide dismutase
MSEFRKYITLVESQTEAYRVKLSYKLDALAPILSKENLDFHYNTLHKNYVEKVNAGETDDFFVGGVVLHNKFFEQFTTPSGKSATGRIKDFVTSIFGSYDSFKDSFTEAALAIHGSGWCYLSDTGKIKIIKNHEPKKDILLIIDMWEHSYLSDYGANKEKYINNFWKIVDWDRINSRLE